VNEMCSSATKWQVTVITKWIIQKV
jgi:hypothetical protein